MGVPFKVNGVSQVTVYNGETLDVSISLEAYQTVYVGTQPYVFKCWDDGVASLLRVGDLVSKRDYTMIYEVARQQSSVSGGCDYRPIVITVIAVFGLVTICFLAYMSRR